jgi:RNA-directed DNA polymerase
MSSGSYFPPSVLNVEIPKKDGGKRKLGIPTVEDRIAQMVVKMYFEPSVERVFHPDSYGYRPRKSALQAVGVARKRTWENDWVLDLDIRKFFDSIDHDLMMKAVRKHTDVKWILLYIERWLKAPEQGADGIKKERTLGTPQGGVISPLLANLYLHYAFDMWVSKEYPQVKFERYADDIVIHCKSLSEAEGLLKDLKRRFAECKLEIHPEKSKIVYCKDSNRRGEYPNTSFDFLGYTFRPRSCRNKQGRLFVNMIPAVSNRAIKEMGDQIRRWKLNSHTQYSIEEIAEKLNPIIRGWINYYGAYSKSVLYKVLQHINRAIAKWLQRKWKKLARHKTRAFKFLELMMNQRTELFAHWGLLKPKAG